MPRLRNNAGMAFAVFVCALVCNVALADEHALPAQTDADLSGEIECAALEGQDFIDIPGAPTAVVSARMTSALETASVSPSFPGGVSWPVEAQSYKQSRPPRARDGPRRLQRAGRPGRHLARGPVGTRHALHQWLRRKPAFPESRLR